MNIFTLTGSILVDADEANKSISKTSEEAEGLGSKLKKGIATAGKWAAGIAGAATMVGGAMVAAAKDTAADLDVIDKGSIRMGVTAEKFQAISYAAGLCGVEMGTVEKATKQLQKAGSELDFDAAIAQLQRIEDDGERSAAAFELFGNAAYDLTPLIDAGAGSMQAMEQEARDLGLVMSGEAVANGAAMNDMFSKVEGSIETLKNGLVAEFMPYVMEILQWVIDNIPMIQETVGKVMDTIIPIVKPILDKVMEFLPPIMDTIKKLLDWITPYLEPILSAVIGVVESVFALLDGDIDGFINGMVENLMSLGKTLFQIGKDIFTALWDGIKNVWEGIKNWIDEKVDWLVDKLAFWKKGNDSMKTDGSHAAGLNYVPYDGYVAELHRGETVLNAGSTQSMVSDIINGIKDKVGGSSGPIELSINLDGRTLAHQLYPSMKYEENRRGASFA